MKPELTENGAVFSYIDTSSSESEVNDHISTYQIITTTISFTDRDNSKAVGQVKEYAIRAIQSYTDFDVVTSAAGVTHVVYQKYENVVTGFSVVPYRIPFSGKVTSSVQTKSGSGVEGVLVTFCHIDYTTGRQDTVSGADACNYMFTTDALGVFFGEIRVSDINWTNQAEYFNVTAFFNETMRDGSFVNHVFSPAYQTVTVNHLQLTSITITDESSITIFGNIAFDPKNTEFHKCPFAGVDVVLTDDKGKNTTTASAADGSFEFSITRGSPGIDYSSFSKPYFPRIHWYC